MFKIILFLLLFPSILYGQKISTTYKRGQENIYNDVIKRLITVYQKDKIDIDTLYFQKDEFLTDSLSDKIQKTEIVFLNFDAIGKKVGEGNSFIIHRLFPLSFRDGWFWIDVVPFNAVKKNDEMLLENTGTLLFSYSFDYVSKQFKFYKVSVSGY